MKKRGCLDAHVWRQHVTGDESTPTRALHSGDRVNQSHAIEEHCTTQYSADKTVHYHTVRSRMYERAAIAELRVAHPAP